MCKIGWTEFVSYFNISVRSTFDTLKGGPIDLKLALNWIKLK